LVSATGLAALVRAAYLFEVARCASDLNFQDAAFQVEQFGRDVVFDHFRNCIGDVFVQVAT
ncbi:MAG: hypothetical protein P8J32_06880, partial [bacterium]|nr:hypothetical protein [bacterium]